MLHIVKSNYKYYMYVGGIEALVTANQLIDFCVKNNMAGDILRLLNNLAYSIHSATGDKDNIGLFDSYEIYVFCTNRYVSILDGGSIPHELNNSVSWLVLTELFYTKDINQTGYAKYNLLGKEYEYNFNSKGKIDKSSIIEHKVHQENLITINLLKQVVIRDWTLTRVTN